MMVKLSKPALAAINTAIQERQNGICSEPDWMVEGMSEPEICGNDLPCPKHDRRNAMHVLYECGICDQLHPWEWSGDCREDANRYASVEDYEERTGISEFGPDGRLQITVRSMAERVEADSPGE